MPHQRVTPFLRSAAREMRSSPIDVEKNLWWRLRGRKLGGLKFRRQHPVGRFIADFVCLEARLIVEVDGRQHQDSQSDAVRTEELRRLGFEVIRFENDRVRIDIDNVCDAILAVATPRVATPHPTPSGPPSPTRGEGSER
jgi:very-short-patch-repair endonuclease